MAGKKGAPFGNRNAAGHRGGGGNMWAKAVYTGMAAGVGSSLARNAVKYSGGGIGAQMTATGVGAVLGYAAGSAVYRHDLKRMGKKKR